MATATFNLTVNTEDFKIVVLCTAAIFLKYLLTLTIQGGKRFGGGTRPPEDSALPFAKGIPQHFGLNPSTKDNPKIKAAIQADVRWQRIVGNDVENLPIGLLIMWVTLLTPSTSNCCCHGLLAIGWTASRIMHTFFYASRIGLPRGLAYMGAVGCQIAMLYGSVSYVLA
mmetsp:Transcript_21195/g.23993  ORF Transcript_21195/g.23993 Transcript_21195/m.23993 type:complete len:169 (+) Transcript_21195:206-712(+)|eukprot:CAMPEP_0114999734 /NCGR_PEP_ID=MMETSP0216-20121206/16325_1 /TAXON_ID=223996 /ORGANISM="Protocruzia adherens, Strain Boccale" /LENGTH=168 /DNA_ID=CAMNT_0002364671 /DNA_START=125 /DNA_END=631 /DNA_ORIENTATION=+